MKVLHIISGLTNGGAEAVLFRLAVNDADNTHHVVSMMDEGYYGKKFHEKNIALFSLNMPPGRLTWNGCKRLYQIMKQVKPDSVQTWMYHADLIGGLIARMVGIKNIHWGVHHTTHNPKDSWRKKLIPKTCALFSFAVPKKILCCADSAVLAHKKLGYSKEKLVCVKNGYDLNQFSPTPDSGETLRREWVESGLMDKGAVVFGMVGRFNAQKDHENLLQALQLLNSQTEINWHCMLVGSEIDSSNNALVDSAYSKNITERVSFLGPTDDVPAFMNAIDIHILPSAFGEAYPNVIAEAMACGTPCIATDVGDSAGMIQDTGWIVQPSDPNALCEAMNTAVQTLLNHPTLWQEHQQSARARAVSEFSLEKMLYQYVSHWRAHDLKAGQ